ncbi:glutaredoxin family protein [Noviherbaspirillum sp.]|uniref:glutaredoxin family protein n=1 Tax=Noviherbaspirillum sp. TaxID=1926288 RepID=UPI002B486BDD|nr:glutaredoxin family protein [Noviherbaspirillum sp.]HJV80748.1 glutaredoxin family protein [Noviherbaspirillum sp.]
MNRVLQSCSALLLLVAASAHAQLYKWVGPDGKVTYSDVAPPATASRVETKGVALGNVSTAGFPFELSEATKNHPVTLYTTRNCGPCDEGRKLLTTRGVPFSEKTVNSAEDAARFRQAAGEDEQVPVLFVGRSKQRGFEPGAWNSALTVAGYPESSKLPSSYRNPQAEPAAPAPKQAGGKPQNAASASKSAANPSATELPPAIGNAPPGFRF